MDTKVDTKNLTIALAGLRLGIGGALVVAPSFAARIWIGPSTETAATRVLARAIGARDLVIGYRTLQAVRDGESSSGWLQLGAMADAADTVAGLLSYRGIPGHRRFTMPIVAGAVGAACFWAARQGAGDADDVAEEVAPDGGASMSDERTPSHESGASEIEDDDLVISLDELVAVAGEAAVVGDAPGTPQGAAAAGGATG